MKKGRRKKGVLFNPKRGPLALLEEIVSVKEGWSIVQE